MDKRVKPLHYLQTNAFSKQEDSYTKWNKLIKWLVKKDNHVYNLTGKEMKLVKNIFSEGYWFFTAFLLEFTMPNYSLNTMSIYLNPYFFHFEIKNFAGILIALESPKSL